MATEKQKNEELQAENQAPGIDAGVAIVGWEAWEYPPFERSRRWYIIASVIGVALLIYAMMTANFVFAVIVIMFALITLIRDIKQPNRVGVYITTAGVVFGNDFYPYQSIKDFSIVYNPPDVKKLYLTFYGYIASTVVIPLEDVNPNDVREALLPYAFENLSRENEYLTDLLARLYKL